MGYSRRRRKPSGTGIFWLRRMVKPLKNPTAWLGLGVFALLVVLVFWGGPLWRLGSRELAAWQLWLQAEPPLSQSVHPPSLEALQAPLLPQEWALLQLVLEDVATFTRQKQYRALYQQLASSSFQASTPQRRFMVAQHCFDVALGPVVEVMPAPRALPSRLPVVRPDGWRLERRWEPARLKGQPGWRIYAVRRKVYRANLTMQETLSFVEEGFQLKLHAWHWHTQHPDVSRCLQQAAAAQVD
jgi:hypothetical protein